MLVDELSSSSWMDVKLWCYVEEAFNSKFISFDFVVFFLNFGASPFFPHEPLRSTYTQRPESLACYLVPCLRDGFVRVSQCTYRKLENLATILLKYHSVGSGVQKCQTGKMTLQRGLWGTTGTSPPEFCDPQTLWFSTRKLWHRCLWKIPPSVTMMLVFPAHSGAEMLGLLNPGNPQADRQPLLGWGLELYLCQLTIRLTLVSAG